MGCDECIGFRYYDCNFYIIGEIFFNRMFFCIWYLSYGNFTLE